MIEYVGTIKPAAPKLDAEQKMFKDTGLDHARQSSNPINGLGWLNDRDFEFMQCLNAALRYHEEGWDAPEPDMFTMVWNEPVAILRTGERLNLNEVREMQHMMAYEDLKAGATVADVAAAIHRPISWVQAVNDEFNL